MTEKPVDWPAEKIKEAIYERGMSMEGLALLNGVSNSACRRALRRSSPAGERLIAELIGVPCHLIWPSRYRPDGSPRARPNVPGNVTRRMRAMQRQKFSPQ